MLLKFYPDASDHEIPSRFRDIQKDILEKEYGWRNKAVYNGMRGGFGPCYELETDEVERVKNILEDFEAVYSAQVKR